MGLEDKEHAKRAAVLKAKIAERNKEREDRRAAGGAPAMALEAKAQEDTAHKMTVVKKVAKKPKKKTTEAKVKVAKVKVAKKPAAKPKTVNPVKVDKLAKSKKAKTNGVSRRTMDRDKGTGLRPIETEIIKICRRLKQPIEVRALAEKLFGADKVLEASGSKDNKRLREVRNALRVPLKKDLLCRAGQGLIVHKDFVDQYDPVSVGQATHSKMQKVARKATGKRT